METLKQISKIILINLLACLTTNCQYQSLQENDLSRNELKGNVKTTTSMSFNMDEDGNEISELKRKTHTRYNRQGNIEEECVYDEESNLERKFTIQYDEKGKEISRCFYDQDNELEGKIYSLYNRKGNIVELQSYNSTSDDMYEQTIIKYDSKGNRAYLKQTFLPTNSTIEIHYKYKDGLLAETISYLNKKELLRYRKTYNEQGKVKEEEWQHEKNKSKERKNFEYDEKSNLFKVSTYRDCGSNKFYLVSEMSFEYDEHANVIKRVSYISDKPIAEERITIEYY